MDVERYYERAFLKLPDDKTAKEEQISKFNKIIDVVKKLDDVNLDEYEELEITSELISPLREDQIVESTDRELIFNNTIHREYGYFKLDNILED